MVSKILIVANATKQDSVLILDAFQMIQKHEPAVRAIFISYLSSFFKKNLGPNTLNQWMKEETESLERVRDYFVRMEIPYSFRVVTPPPWEAIVNEVEGGDQELIILQGELLKIWRAGAGYEWCFQVIHRSKYPILFIHQSEDSFDSQLLNLEAPR